MFKAGRGLFTPHMLYFNSFQIIPCSCKLQSTRGGNFTQVFSVSCPRNNQSWLVRFLYVLTKTQRKEAENTGWYSIASSLRTGIQWNIYIHSRTSCHCLWQSCRPLIQDYVRSMSVMGWRDAFDQGLAIMFPHRMPDLYFCTG